MESSEQQPLPVPIEEGLVNQVLVRYLGSRLGAVTIRGRLSGRSYRPSASGPMFWVLEEDAELFHALVDFELLDDHRIDLAERDREKVASELAALRDEIEQLRQEAPAPPAPANSRRRGRPPTPIDEKLLWHHLQRHCPTEWSNRQLAQIYMKDSRDPTGTMGTSLRRFRKKYPDVVSDEDNCRWCRDDFCPDPPEFE